jgi:molybdenum cofactor biosynthesis enzyme MoaA
MSLENFHWLLDFIKKSNQHEVRLIGGEPTLHPKFIEILQE